MHLFEITGNEADPAYQELQISNSDRHYDFLRSIVVASLSTGRPFLSQAVIKALNFHAIACLHINAGEYRPCEVEVGIHKPPAVYRVQSLMDDMVNTVNRAWVDADPVFLASYVLWRINHIHPFINGNGRTARASCYFVLCLKSKALLPGAPILPELLRRDRADYVKALQEVDASVAAGKLDITPLHALVTKLLEEQLATAGFPAT
ncbi:MAG: Fic family protein [Thalassobaculum sp.]